MSNSRRNFIRHSATALAGTTLATAIPTESFAAASKKRVAPSDKLRFGVIGCKGMGWSDMNAHLKMPEVDCVALADVDQSVLDERAKNVEDQRGHKPQVFKDYRKMLEMKDLDAIIIGTPDHWHCLAFVDSLSSGRHVYVEKPISARIEECNVMLKAAKRYNNKMVQVGQWQRSGTHYAQAHEYLKSGKLGNIRLVKVWAYQGWMNPVPVLPDSAPPAGVDYDMWLGPAPKRPFNQNRFHFNFRWFWDYAGGLMTDWGVHEIDIALFFMGASAPKSIMASGGKLAYPGDASETPDTLQAVFEYDNFNMLWEHATGIDNSPAALVYTATSANRLYGSANPALTGSIVGFASGDNQANTTTGTLTFSSTTTSATPAGSYAITGSGLTANNGNYTFAQAAGNATALTISPLPITVSGGRIYNGLATAAASILTIGNNLDGANVTLSGAANLAGKSVGAPAVSAGALVLGGPAAGNYTLAGLSGSVTITSKDAHLTGLVAQDKFYDGTTAATLICTPSFTAGDIVSGDDASLASASAPTGAFVDREIANAKPVPYSSAFSMSGADANNYHLVLPSLSASILNHKEDGGTTTNTTANSLALDLVLNSGKLLANNDPAGGSINGAGTIAVNANAILGGTGNAGGVSVNAGGALAPGVNVGVLHTGSETWDSGGVYAFQISSATGAAGVNWDLANITGDLNLHASITNAFKVVAYTLNGSVAGPAANFNNTHDYEWPLVTVTGSILNFDATKFIVDASQFQNNQGYGKFGLKLSSDLKSLNLFFTHNCAASQTTSTYAIGADGNMHLYFSNPFGMLNATALNLRNCSIPMGTAFGPGFESGQQFFGLPFTSKNDTAELPAVTTRLELIAVKLDDGLSAAVNVIINDACGGKGGFDPVVSQLEVQQGGVARQSFSNIPAAEHYARVVNGTPGLNWLCLVVNGKVFLINPLAAGQDLTFDIGAAMAEGSSNTVAFCGQGVAGASALITIGDTLYDISAPLTEPTGTDAEYWTNLAGAGENPLLHIALSGENIVLSWSDMWDGFGVQTRAGLTPESGWVSLDAAPELANGQFTITVPASTGMFFRLTKIQ